MIINEITVWIFITAVLFTLVGYVWGLRTQLKNVIAATIDSLIADGYLKTQGTGKNREILKWREWSNDKAS